MDEICFRMEQVTGWQRGGRLAAERITFSVREKEWLWITGEEPEDLTVLGEMAMGIRRPQEGRICMECPPGILPENFPYLEGLAAAEYLMLPLLAAGIPRETAWRKARPLIRESSLWEKRSVGAEFLTEYEKGLLAAMAAFSGEPRLLLAGNSMKTLTAGERKLLGEWIKRQALIRGTAILAMGNGWEGSFPFHRRMRLQAGMLS